MDGIVKGPEAEGNLHTLFNIASLLSDKSRSHMRWMGEKDRLILVAVTGSRAYGTNRPDSDYDYKGVCVPPHQYRMGFLHKFDQLEVKQPIDCTIFNVIKFVQMAAACNPNILDVLFAHGDDLVVCNHVGQILRNARQDFLSKKASASFRGYAMSQIKRIKRHRRWLLDPPTHRPLRSEFGLSDMVAISKDQLNAAMSRIQKQIDSWEIDFGQMDDAEKIYVKEQMYRRLTELEIADDEQFAAAGRLLGYEENFLEMLTREKQWRQAVLDWEHYQNWKKHRNPARAALEKKFGYDTKHGMHLVRLMTMCREIGTTGDVIVKRVHDAPKLRGVLNGEWAFDYLDSWAEEQDKDLIEVWRKSSLPRTPDFAKLDELCQNLIWAVENPV